MKAKKTNRVKIPVYFDKIKEAPALAMLEHFRVLSQTDMSMAKFIKYMAIEFCLAIDKSERDKLEKEQADAKEKEEDQNIQGSTESAGESGD